MRRLPTLAVVIALALGALDVLAQTPTQTTEVLVLASAAVELPRLSQRRGLEIQNRGPNSIYCALGSSAAAVVTKARELQNGDAWSLDATEAIRIFCIAATADQVTGAATIVTELR